MNVPLITPAMMGLKSVFGRDRGTLSWMDSSVTRMEAASRLYSTRDPKMWELVPRLIGVIDDCVEMNTKACLGVPLRLYRMSKETTSGERSRYPGRKSSPAVRKRIDAIRSGAMGQKNAMLADLGGDIEEITDHPALDFVRRPNPLFPGQTMAYMRFRCKWAFGEYYIFVIRGTDGAPLKAFPMYPHFTRIQFSKTGYIEKYLYGRDQASAKPYKPEDVIFFKHRPALSNPLRGESPLASHLPQADLIYKNMMHDIGFVDGGNRPDSVVTMNDPNATDKQVRQIEDRIASLASGAMQSIRALVLRNATWTNVSYPPKDLETEAKVSRYISEARGAYGHTESMHDSGESNVASAVVGYNAQFMGGTVHPALVNDQSELTDLLLPMYGYEECEYFFAYDNPVKADQLKEVERVKTLENNALVTINEAREMLGQPKSDDPAADVLRFNGMSLAMMDKGPSGDATNPFAALFGGGGGSPDSAAADDDEIDAGADDTGEAPEADDDSQAVEDAEKSKAQKANARAEVRTMAVGIKYADESTPCGCCSKDAGLTGDAEIDALIRDTYPRLLDEMKGTLWDMEEQTIAAIISGRAVPLNDQARKLNEILLEMMMPVVERSAQTMVDKLVSAGVRGTGDGFKPTQAIQAYKDHVSLVADDIAQYTEVLIGPAIDRGLELGLSRAEIADEIQNADIPSWRAERIVRTESSEAINGGRYDTMDEIGIEMVKVVTAPNPSKAHAVIAKRSPKKIGENFVTAGETIEGEKIRYSKSRPPFRPNCKCRIEPVIE